MKNNKKLGQHWLKDRAILDKIADLALPNAPESPLAAPESRLCIEIGPGLGTLTSSLLRRFKRVIAVEYDENLAKNLPKSFPGTNLEVINADFLDFDLASVATPYVVAGNIPYYITSPIVAKLLTTENPPLKIVLLMQKEVAERLLAAPGDYTYLSVFTQNYADVAAGPFVPRSLFTPPPQVDSSVVILTPKKPLLSSAELNFVKRSFVNPRKKLVKNLPVDRETAQNALLKLGISVDARPADLTLKDWKSLAKLLKVV